VQGPVFGEVAADLPGASMKEDLAEAIRSGPGGLLLRRLQGLRLEGLEKSFKISDGTLLADRYLVGIHKSFIAPARLFELCVQIGMPEKYLPGLKENAQEANAFHFGFEGKGAGGLFKVYLEFAHRLRPGGTAPVLLHLAYKWDCLDGGSATIASYTCHPGLSADAVAARLTGGGSFDAAAKILRIAAARTAEPLMYLEVGEEGNPRTSFDLNLHAAGIRIEEVGELLAKACAQYSIAEGQFQALYERIKRRSLGHLSGGINREGRDFLTLYYPVERL